MRRLGGSGICIRGLLGVSVLFLSFYILGFCVDIFESEGQYGGSLI